MSLETSVRDALLASSTLRTAMTGGIWAWENTGEHGLTRVALPSAFDSEGRIKPCILVKERNRIGTPAIRDAGLQVASTIQAVEIWLYGDRTSTSASATLETAKSSVYTLLADRYVDSQYMMFREDRIGTDYTIDARWRMFVFDANGVLGG